MRATAGVSKTRNEPVKRINVLRGPRTTSIRCALSDLVDDPEPFVSSIQTFPFTASRFSLSLSPSPLIFFGCRDFDDSLPPSIPELRRRVALIPHHPLFPENPRISANERTYTLLRIVRKIIFNPPGWQVGDYLSSLFLSRPHYSSSSAKFLG